MDINAADECVSTAKEVFPEKFTMKHKCHGCNAGFFHPKRLYRHLEEVHKLSKNESAEIIYIILVDNASAPQVPPVHSPQVPPVHSPQVPEVHSPQVPKVHSQQIPEARSPQNPKVHSLQVPDYLVMICLQVPDYLVMIWL